VKHIVLALIVVGFGGAAFAQERPAQPPIAGVWKLNTDKSNVRLPEGAIEIRQYGMRADGFLVGLLITNSPQAGYHFLQFTSKSDGRDYPEYSDAIVSELIVKGTPTPRTYSETLDDEYTTDWTDKVNGRVTGHGKKIVSKDGKTLTITVDGSPQIRVYDRQ
jgi:hypothetical protein